MSAQRASRATAAASPAAGAPDALRLRIDGQRVSDVDLAAVTVAVAALLGAPGGQDTPEAGAAWRRAGMQEASTARRIRSPGELRASEAR